MNKKGLQSKIKPTVLIYLAWFLFGSHYAFLGKWNTQILYWITLGGLGVWAIVDLITMSDKILKHREMIFQQIEEIENKEKIVKHIANKHKTPLKLNLIGGELISKQKAVSTRTKSFHQTMKSETGEQKLKYYRFKADTKGKIISEIPISIN